MDGKSLFLLHIPGSGKKLILHPRLDSVSLGIGKIGQAFSLTTCRSGQAVPEMPKFFLLLLLLHCHLFLRRRLPPVLVAGCDDLYRSGFYSNCFLLQSGLSLTGS